MASKRQVELLWLGARSNGLGWLLRRIEDIAKVTVAEEHSLDVCSLEEMLADTDSRFNRVVFGCPDRLSFPREELAWMASQRPEIPVALACDHWTEGSGRTGLFGRGHLALGWYRWWDHWTDWLVGSNSNLLSPSTSFRSGLTVSGETPELTAGRGMVIADCIYTAAAWSESARACRQEVMHQCTHTFQQGLPTEESPDWILWDDSCLRTIPGSNESEQYLQHIRIAQNQHPHAWLGAALTIPRWDVWQMLEEAGVREIFVKPNDGACLIRALAEFQAQSLAQAETRIQL